MPRCSLNTGILTRNWGVAMLSPIENVFFIFLNLFFNVSESNDQYVRIEIWMIRCIKQVFPRNLILCLILKKTSPNYDFGILAYFVKKIISAK